jgi:hypothetical protein
MFSLSSSFLFSEHFVGNELSDSFTSLPFAIGGSRQQGLHHMMDGQNNQDSVGILVGENCLMGVVSDGCSSTHLETRNSVSNNEFGSNLLTHLVLKLSKDILAKYCDIEDDRFLSLLSNKLLENVNAISSIVTSGDKREREIFLCDHFMATIVGFVICHGKYFVFGSGDGFYGVDNMINEITFDGKYLALNLLDEVESGDCSIGKTDKSHFETSGGKKLSILNSGSTEEINNIFIATDGFDVIVKQNEVALRDFIIGCSEESRPGIFPASRYIRKYLLENDNVKRYANDFLWPQDDASFVLLSRIKH